MKSYMDILAHAKKIFTDAIGDGEIPTNVLLSQILARADTDNGGIILKWILENASQEEKIKFKNEMGDYMLFVNDCRRAKNNKF